MPKDIRLSSELLNRMADIVGARYVLSREQAGATFLEERRGNFSMDAAAAVLRPGNVREVAALVALCAETDTVIVPQGGNTGLCGGAVPLAPPMDEAGRLSILLNLGRLNHIRQVDADNNTLTAEAGCILKDVQEAATAQDRLFPLSLAAEGSCQIGGVLSTNAGGVMTLRYGNMRDLTLGLEVVTAKGEIWNGLRALRKDNTGYDLKQLFIGAEGTLGIITAAVLKLFPRPNARETVLFAVESPDKALKLLHFVRAELGDNLFAFELMAELGVALCHKHLGLANPLSVSSPWLVLADFSMGGAADHLRPQIESTLERAYESELFKDAVLAENEGQRQALWTLRESLPEAPRREGGSLHHDISVPVSAVPDFIDRVETRAREQQPGIRTMPFGHVGDGNIHYTLLFPEGSDPSAFKAQADTFRQLVHETARAFGGSISAEHGIGLIKKAELAATLPPHEIEMMRAIKRALDPENLLNHGKILA